MSRFSEFSRFGALKSGNGNEWFSILGQCPETSASWRMRCDIMWYFNWSRKCIPRKNSFCSHCACGCCRWGHFGSCCKSSVCELIQVSYGTRRRTSLYLNGNAGIRNRSLTWLNVMSAKNSISYHLELITSPKDGRLFVCFRPVPCGDDQFWSLTKFPFSWLSTIKDQRKKCGFFYQSRILGWLTSISSLGPFTTISAISAVSTISEPQLQNHY